MANISIPQSYEQTIDRALHNLYAERRTTLHPMTAIPIYFRRMFPGDKFDFRITEALLQSQPTFAPLMGNWRLRFEWYFDSDANRYSWIDNNTRLSSEEVMNRKHHTFNMSNALVEDQLYDYNALTHDVEGYTIARGSIADYAGFAPGFAPVIPSDEEGNEARYMSNTQGFKFNLDFFLSYLNIIRCYHVNRQDTSVPYVNGAFITEGLSDVPFTTMSADVMDKLMMFFRSCPNGCHIDLSLDEENDDIPSWLAVHYSNELFEFRRWMRTIISPCGGLFCTQFEPDLYQNLLSNDQNLLRSVVTIQDGGFSVDTFRLRNHLQVLYDEIFVSGGTNRDLSRTRWGVKSNRQYDIPELICVRSEIIGTNLITSNNAGSNGDEITSAPGDMAGNVNTRRNGGVSQKFEAKTGGNLMCIVTLTPLVDYSQNNLRYLYENHFEDEFSPQMARKGFENVPVTDYCSLPGFAELPAPSDGLSMALGSNDPNLSVGKQVAWLREMTDTNRVFGEFSNGGTQSDWVLRRKFGFSRENYPFLFDQFSPYGNPLEFQYPFVYKDIKSPNFYLQVGFDVKALRPIGRRFMPTLGV